MAAEVERPRILYGDAGPEPPYPLRMEGAVISGFGRGSKELGIPTANLPVDEAVTPWIATAKSGVYFGYASLALPDTHPDHPRHHRRHRGNPRAPADAPPAPLASDTTPAPTSDAPAPESRWQIYPMVMSIGYNPFYKNSVRSAEVHVLHSFGADFYDAPMRLLILGFVREERDYPSLDALVVDINVDCEVARQSLARPGWTPRQGVVGGASGEFDGEWLVREE
ncbi:riboflavin kinase [Annulohypoxylon nitens]|nr:riboflavin kinase [Annulohypoxylon nitens]